MRAERERERREICYQLTWSFFIFNFSRAKRDYLLDSILFHFKNFFVIWKLEVREKNIFHCFLLTGEIKEEERWTQNVEADLSSGKREREASHHKRGVLLLLSSSYEYSKGEFFKNLLLLVISLSLSFSCQYIHRVPSMSSHTIVRGREQSHMNQNNSTRGREVLMM